MPEYVTTIEEMRYRARSRCRICGESIYNGSSFYTDGYNTVHLGCEDLLKGEASNEQTL